MHVHETLLFQDFQQARLAAVEVTDQYRGLPAGEPHKDELWRIVITRTEVAQELLRRWLTDENAPDSLPRPERQSSGAFTRG